MSEFNPHNPSVDPDNSNPDWRSRPRRNKIMVQMELDKMYELLVAGATDRQLMKALGMSARLYYHYKNKLYDRADQVQKDKTEKVVTHAQHVFVDRLLRMIRLIDHKLEDHAKLSGEDMCNLIRMSQELNINLFKMEAEGVRVSLRDAARLNSIEKYHMPKYLQDKTKDNVKEYYTNSNGIVQYQQQQQDKDNDNEELEELEEIPPPIEEPQGSEEQQQR